MPPRGVGRFSAPTFGPEQAAEIRDKLKAGRHTEVDEQLIHLVHEGVPPSTLWEQAQERGRRDRDHELGGPP
jgi:hypothetical protein